MADELIYKEDILKILTLKKSKWSEFKGKKQDVVQEATIDNVIMTIDWIASEIEKMTPVF